MKKLRIFIQLTFCKQITETGKYLIFGSGNILAPDTHTTWS